MGRTAAVNRIELRDTDASTRISQKNYSIYVSSDNKSYSKVSHWELESNNVGNRIIHSLLFSGITARYIKIHVNSPDDDVTFILNNVLTDAQVYGEYPNKIPFTYGYTLKDIKPTETGLTHLGYQGIAWVDDENRSTGFDMGRTAAVNRIELRDTDASTRISQKNYSIYVSSDNKSYSKVSHWELESNNVGNRIIHSLLFSGITARYIKIHVNSPDDDVTFILNNVLTDAQVFGEYTS
ncbi:hypothetical protein PAECIP111894_06053 [Paenibacillus pseudetheri]|uniref:F5/8 type C domain-containing protein n=2 Tax=Paenibacillus pseudetheri TaxID=2897682 RepID=A0ABM9BMZ6_9BACL|nr:hypothetical protein PAECIP111894_06053 [Paenibacillus pseudetheri]